MNHSSQAFLAHPALAGDEHGRIDARDATGELEHLLHGGTLRGDAFRFGLRAVRRELLALRTQLSFGELQFPSRVLEGLIERTGGNRTRAAASLGIGPATLYRKLKAYGETAR